ncbi:MAG: tripartite tricarboxylate transporter TctB family protein [Rhodospirillales bacterium]
MWDRILGSGVVALALGYLFATYQLPVDKTGDPIGPQMFPYMIGIGILVCGIWILLESFYKKQTAGDAPSARESSDYVKSRPLAAIGVLAWAATYFALFEVLGFAISCSIFLFGMTSFFNRGKWLINGLVSVIFSFGIFYAFTQLLDVKLAPGPLPY